MNLQVCNNGHDEITYYGAYKDCPFCRYIKEQDNKDAKINGLYYSLEEAQYEYEALDTSYNGTLEECAKLEEKLVELEDEYQEKCDEYDELLEKYEVLKFERGLDKYR